VTSTADIVSQLYCSQKSTPSRSELMIDLEFHQHVRISSMFKSLTLSFLLAILTCPSWGQTAETLPDAPTVQDTQPSAHNFAMKAQHVPPQATVGVFDRHFTIAALALVASSVFDAEMILRCEPKACQAVPAALRSRASIYSIAIPADIGVAYISSRLRRTRYDRMWYVPMLVGTVGNVVYGVHAAQCGGNGCLYFSGNPR
jgi:hypothetical protein